MKKSFQFLMSVFLVMLLAACGDDDSAGGNSTLTWAAGAQGGGWYSMAGGISSLIGEHSDININTIPGGSMQNMPFIASDEAQLAWMQPPFIIAGLSGEEPFEEKYENVSIIGNGFGTNHFHFIIADNSGINSIDEIFEQEMAVDIAVTPVNNSDEWVFRKFLDFYGVTYEDIRSWGGSIIHGSYQEQSDALRNGNADVIFAQLALPAASVTEVSVGRDVRILPMSEELMDYLTQFGLEKNSIPAGTYPQVINGNDEIPTATMGNTLTVNSNLDEEVVYQITKIINENRDYLPNIHASLEAYKVENATEGLTAELHPGAARYYREIGQID